jgi:maleate isomerase
LKTAAQSELFHALREVYRGRPFLDPRLACSATYHLFSASSDAVQRGKRRKKLSRRETEVLNAIALGHTTKEIALDLEVSEKTVQTYRERIYTKLELQTRSDLVHYALAHGLSDAEIAVVGYGCTSGSFYRGRRHQMEIEAKIEKVSKAPCVSTAWAVVSALKALEVDHVVIATPYTDRINELEKRYLESNGLEVVDLKGLGLINNMEIGKQEPVVAYNLARRLRYSEADGVFISCTNFRTMEIIENLEKEIEKPVLSSNSATAWAMLKKVRLENRIRGFGTIFAR